MACKRPSFVEISKLCKEWGYPAVSNADELVKLMGLENAPNFYFVSHSSADNPLIRPIILGMLEAKIPLWFDKPDKIGIELKNFVGKVPSGVDYAVALDVALERARGCIWFPSTVLRGEQRVRRGIAACQLPGEQAAL